MTTPETLATRIHAILATAADNRPTDIDDLLADLTTEDIGTVVFGIANLAITAMMPPGTNPRDTENRARVAAGLRQQILQAALDQPDAGA